MVEINKLTIGYDNKKIFIDFNCTLPNDSINVIVGRSGVGKTTLLNVIAGLLQFGGEINGNDSVSYVFQQPRLIECITVFDNLMLVAEGIAADRRSDVISQLLQRANIAELANRRASTLSGGEKQRVALVRAFLSPSSVLLMDEPMQSLDMVSKQQLSNLLLDLLNVENKCVIYVTHDLYECMAIADNIYCLTEGNGIELVASLDHDQSSRDILCEKYSEIKKRIIDMLS